MTLRIAPLDSPNLSIGGLTIQPLGDFLTSLLSPGGAARATGIPFFGSSA